MKIFIYILIAYCISNMVLFVCTRKYVIKNLTQDDEEMLEFSEEARFYMENRKTVTKIFSGIRFVIEMSLSYWVIYTIARIEIKKSKDIDERISFLMEED